MIVKVTHKVDQYKIHHLSISIVGSSQLVQCFKPFFKCEYDCNINLLIMKYLSKYNLPMNHLISWPYCFGAAALVLHVVLFSAASVTLI